MKTKGLGKDQRATLDFYSRFSGRHSFARGCRDTVRVIKSLVRRGLLESNEFFKARTIEEKGLDKRQLSASIQSNARPRALHSNRRCL
jgi:hypothetical protein